ncbi:hypothetical protein BGX27_009537 [Mortierella sp. AM989]|nr:hypothetical protein BGX27_009537 [Mortierella sp. AM989]
MLQTDQSPSQAFRLVYLDIKSGSTAIAPKMARLKSRHDKKLEKYIILWDDITQAFKDATRVEYEDGTVVPFLRDDDFQLIEPLRIAAEPDVALHIVVEDSNTEVGRSSLETMSSLHFNSAFTTSQGYHNEDPQVRQAPRAPEDRGAQTFNWFLATEALSRAPQLFARFSRGASEFYEHTQPSFEEISGSDSLENTDEHRERVMDSNYKRGMAYFEGSGIQKDDLKAMEFFVKAADQGHISAQFHVGCMYYYGNGVTQDRSEAAKWYEKAANQGNPDAQTYLGEMYTNGFGVPQDYKTAAKWLILAAEQGKAYAQGSLAELYKRGNGVPQDYFKMIEWYQKAISQGVKDVSESFLGKTF